MNNKYYVVNNEVPSHIIVAMFSDSTGHFYDYHNFDGALFAKDDLALAKSFSLTDETFMPTGEDANARILGEVTKMQEYEKLKEANRPDLWPNPEVIPKTDEIVDSYFAKRASQGEKLDPYIVDIISTLAKPMGLKLTNRHGNSFYAESGYDYPEDIQDILGAMYQIISAFLAHSDLPMVLELCSYGQKGPNYTEFTRRIELLTGFPSALITSDIKYRQDATLFQGAGYPGFSDSFDQLIIQCPRFIIGKDQSIYEHNCVDLNTPKEVITPQPSTEVDLNFPRGRHKKTKEEC